MLLKTKELCVLMIMVGTRDVSANQNTTRLVPVLTSKARVAPATENINPAPVLTAKPGTAKNASAIQVTNTPVTAPTRAPAEPAATENINLVTAAEHMIGTEAHAAVRLLTDILVPEPVMPEATEPVVTINIHPATAPQVII